MPSCPAFDPLGAYVVEVTDLVDCHARALGEEGYRALGSGSPFGVVLAGFVTIYIALIGYRLLLGAALEIRDGVIAAVRIGLVLALATQWSAYRAVAYGVAIDAPAEIAMSVLAPGGLGGDDQRGLIARVQAVYDVIDASLRGNAATPGLLPPAPVQPPASVTLPEPDAKSLAPSPAPSPVVLAASSTILIVGTLAGSLSVRVVAGLLLALGPLFIAFALFEATRGLFVGWICALSAAALGAVAVPAILALELAILEPQVRTLQQSLLTNDPVPILSGEIFATTALFALVLLAVLIATTRATAGFRLPDGVRRDDRPRQHTRVDGPGMTAAIHARDQILSSTTSERPRALAIADSLATLQRHEKNWLGGGRQIPTDDRALAAQNARDGYDLMAQPLGQRFRRRAPRQSSIGARRDGIV